jgi:hypothetical protein
MFTTPSPSSLSVMYRSKLFSPHFKWLCIASVVFACGCSGSNDSFKDAKDEVTPDGGPTSADAADAGEVGTIIDPTLASTQEELIGAECSMLYRCCSAQELKERFGIDSVETECDDFQSALPTSIHLANLTSSIEEGRLTFDPGMAELCAQSYLDQDCSEWTRLSPSRTTLAGCIEMIIPQVEEGENCKNEYECITGSCVREDADAEFGTCTAPAGEGEGCFDTLCAPELYCATFEDACVPRKQDGQSCLDDRECQSNACTSNTEGEMRCSPPAPLCAAGLEDGQ